MSEDNLGYLLLVFVGIIPAIISAVAYFLLPTVNGRKSFVIALLVFTGLSIFTSPIAACLIADSPRAHPMYGFLMGIILSCMYVPVLERRVISSLLNNEQNYYERYHPTDANDIRCRSRNRSIIFFLALYILLFYYGSFVALIMLPLQTLAGFHYETIFIGAVAIGGFLYFLYMGLLRLLIRCEHCHNNLFEMYEREFVKMALNALFNKYVVCMYCHARFSLGENVDLDNLPNNHQADYSKPPTE